MKSKRYIVCYTKCGQDEHAAVALRLLDMLANPRFALAYGLVCEGFSVIPLCSDGKKPARKWKEFQTRQPTVEELADWFFVRSFRPAIVTGELSDITVIDCDSDDALQACLRSGIESPMGQTTKRGRHMVFRHNGERNTVRVDGMVGVDRRGEGGYVKAYPDSSQWTREAVLLAPAL